MPPPPTARPPPDPVQVIGRAEFESLLGDALAGLSGGGPGLAVLVIDIDGIARINRTLGHRAGDRVLEDLGRQMRGSMQAGDLFARFTGERFITLSAVAGEGEAVRIANALVDVVRAPRFIDNLEMRLSASIGIALTADADARVEDILRDVDVATQSAQHRGPNHVEIFRPQLRRRIVRQLALEAELHAAFEHDELELHFQPIVSVRESRLIAIEALVRWHHPHRGLVPPAQFMPAAEDSGLIMDIGDWILDEVCTRVARWRDEDPSGDCPPVTVNISPRQLSEGTLGNRVSAALLATRIPPSALIVEITETSAMELQHGPPEAIDALKRIGVGVLLDDFGTGYSSLAWLAQLPIDGVKVDRAFVNGVSTVTDPGPVLSAVVDMGQALGLTIIAEGVETPAQLAAVQAVGVDAVQGFFIARPTPTKSSADLDRLTRRSLATSTEVAASVNPGPGPDEPIPLGEAASLIGVSASFMRRLAEQGAIPVIRAGGGPRRFRRHDLKRFARQRFADVRLTPRDLPSGPLPKVTALLRDSGPTLIDGVQVTMYSGARPGWFGTTQGRTRTILWLDPFVDALGRAEHREAVDGTASFLELALLAGASTAECVRFLGQFGQLTGRALLLAGGPGGEVRGIHEIAAAAIEAFLARLDR